MVHNLEAPSLLWKRSIPLKLGISLESNFLILHNHKIWGEKSMVQLRA